MRDRKATGDHESDQGDDCQRHVHVEDLLDEALIGIDRGVEENEREGAGKRQHGCDRKRPQSLSEQCAVQAAYSSIRKSNKAYAKSPNTAS
jgi:hypothetical protein